MPRHAAEPRRVNFDDLELDDELALLNGMPFTGIVFSERGDGSLESETCYVDGLPDGLELEWHPAGQLAKRAMAVRGNGLSVAETWYPSGARRSVKRYIDRRLTEAEAWDEDGRPIDPERLEADNAFGTGAVME
jgi:antitoxin component YwqK of YwqJK toxin-antitoxin module